MLKGIDHLVILVSDLEAATEDYRQQGFTVVPGGRHPGIGTYNALIRLTDGSYLELLAFHKPNRGSRWWRKLEQGGGFIGVCLQTDDLRAEIAALRTAGIGMSDPQSLSRARPDGYLLKWMNSMHTGEHPDVVPFLIEDETPRDERVPKETQHHNDVTGIDTVVIAVDELQTIRLGYARLLGHEGQEIERAELNGVGVRFTIGEHHIDFLTPKGQSGALHDWLCAREPSPFSFSFTRAFG